MMRTTLWLLIFSLILGMEFSSTAVYAESDRTIQNTNGRTVLNLNSDWGFYRGDLAGSKAID